MLQIVGDEDIFGEKKIVEPFDEEGDGGGKGGPSVNMGTHRVVFNVWIWPSVRFVYGPRYRVWISPFYFGFYPTWWRPWRPRPFRAFYNRTVVFRPRYRVATTHRVVRAHRVYTPKRRTSKVVHTRTTTRVAGKNGKVGVSRTTTKTTVRGKNGAAAGKRTTTTRGVRKNQNGTVGKKRTTTVRGARGKNGAAVGKKRTTTVRKRKN